MARDLPTECKNCGSKNITTSADGSKTKCHACKCTRWEVMADQEPADSMKALRKSASRAPSANEFQAIGFAIRHGWV
jgi:transcription initiation factor TFIIIB Brf1 subunit/transcription initiation factor TFIIB